jgi:hypothetical protein
MLIVTLGIMVVGCGGSGAVEPGSKQASAAAVKAAPLDHEPFDRLLQSHVKDGVVDYGGFEKEEAALDAYLAALAAADLSGTSREEKLAFYINAYNACTVRLIMRHLGSIKSIKEIHQPWDTREWTLAGEVLSLNEVEHKKLREELQEPRIHFAIVCASIGCPDLAARAYTAGNINTELDEATRKFLQSDKHLRTSEGGGLLGKTYVLELSQIFNWFEADFTDGNTAPVADFVVKYTDPETAAFIREHDDRLKISHLDYDWNLNGKD